MAAKHIHVYLGKQNKARDVLTSSEASELERAQEEASQISKKIDSIVQSGGRVTPSDPLSVKLGHLRGRISVLKRKQQAKDATNHLGEREYYTYKRWKEACRAANPSVRFEGDEDICNALPGVGEWDGVKGSIYNKKTGDADFPTFITYQGKQYAKTGKTGTNNKSGNATAEYRYHPESGKADERVWFDPKTKVITEDARSVAEINKEIAEIERMIDKVKNERRPVPSHLEDLIEELAKERKAAQKSKDAEFKPMDKTLLQKINQSLTQAARDAETLMANVKADTFLANKAQGLASLIDAARNRCFDLR